MGRVREIKKISKQKMKQRSQGWAIILLFIIISVSVAGLMYLYSLGLWDLWRGLGVDYCDSLCQLGRMG